MLGGPGTDQEPISVVLTNTHGFMDEAEKWIDQLEGKLHGGSPVAETVGKGQGLTGVLNSDLLFLRERLQRLSVQLSGLTNRI